MNGVEDGADGPPPAANHEEPAVPANDEAGADGPPLAANHEPAVPAIDEAGADGPPPAANGPPAAAEPAGAANNGHAGAVVAGGRHAATVGRGHAATAGRGHVATAGRGSAAAGGRPWRTYNRDNNNQQVIFHLCLSLFCYTLEPYTYKKCNCLQIEVHPILFVKRVLVTSLGRCGIFIF